MSKISRLEKQKLAEIYKKLAPINNLLKDHSDCVDDLLYDQMDIVVGEDDINAFRKAIEVLTKHKDSFHYVFENINLLIEHFEV